MKILSCGAGMQSTALALMACEKVKHPYKYPYVPIYDAIIFCDLGEEPIWVYEQVEFIRKACEEAGILFIVLVTDLYGHYLNNYGKGRVVSIPFWTVNENGKLGRTRRNCTQDYKIRAIQQHVRWELLGYEKGKKMKQEDKKAHEMHLGFSVEERHRVAENMFVNCFPLVDMKKTRAGNYAYILETWGLDTKASACTFCPFHTNYFFQYLREHYPETYKKAIDFDEMLERKHPKTLMRNKMYISSSGKRLLDLTDEDCQDAECFEYKGQYIWNGF